VREKLDSLEPYLFIYAGQGEKGRSLGDFYAMDIRKPEKRWQKIMVEPPHARHQHTICGFRKGHPRRHEQKMYMFGGINMPENILFNDVWVFEFKGMKINQYDEEDIEECKFTEIECTGEAPSERKGHTALCYGNSMYVFGGQTQDLNENITDWIYKLDLTHFVWSKIDTSLAKITPRCQISTTWLSDSTILVLLLLTVVLWRT